MNINDEIITYINAADVKKGTLIKIKTDGLRVNSFGKVKFEFAVEMSGKTRKINLNAQQLKQIAKLTGTDETLGWVGKILVANPKTFTIQEGADKGKEVVSLDFVGVQAQL